MKSTAQSQQISHCAVDKPQGSIVPPCSDASVQSGPCARHDASPPGGPLQDTAVSPGCDVVASTTTDNNCKADLTYDDVVVKTETDKSC